MVGGPAGGLGLSSVPESVLGVEQLLLWLVCSGTAVGISSCRSWVGYGSKRIVYLICRLSYKR